MKIKKGFTLVELVVVIAIVSLLASITYASVSSGRDKAIDAKNKKIATNFETNLELAMLDGLTSVTQLASLNPAVSVSNTGVATSTDVPGASFDIRRGIVNTNPKNSIADIVESGIVPRIDGVLQELPKVSSRLNGGLDEEIYYISNGTQAIDSRGYEYVCVDRANLPLREFVFEGEEYGVYDGYTWISYNPSGFSALLNAEVPSEIYFTLARGDKSNEKRLVVRNYYTNFWLPHRNSEPEEDYLPDLPFFEDWIYDADFSPKMPYYSDDDFAQGKTLNEERLGIYTCL